MVQKRKINKPTSVRRISTPVSSGKSKLGAISLDWITDTTEGETIVEEQAGNIPNKSAGVSKEPKIGVVKQYSSEETVIKEKKTPFEKKKTVAAAAKEEVPPSVKRKWMRMSSIGGALKKGGKKVSGTVAKPFKSDKKIFRTSLNATINVIKKPVKAISAVDRKITQSMKKVVLSGDNENADKGVLSNIKSADVQITKSAKKLIDSILD